MSFWRFIGLEGEHIVTPTTGYGIPGRDLSDEDVEAIDPEARGTLEYHIANNPHPIFEKQDGDLPARVAPEPAPEPAPAVAVEPAVQEPAAVPEGG